MVAVRPRSIWSPAPAAWICCAPPLPPWPTRCALKTRYPALHFVACNNTLFNLRRKGLPVKLVQEAEVAPSAVGFVVDHLKRGWTFLTI